MALTKISTGGIADDAVTEAKVANDAIGLAEMKGGTDGKIIAYDANGDPHTVGPGTDGQVLTSAGAGEIPAFEDAVSEGEDVKSTTNGNEANTKFLRADGDGTCSWQVPVGGATGADFNDNTEVRFGTGNDLVITHTGNSASIVNTSGGMAIDSGVGLDITTGGDITIGAGHPVIIEAITGNAGGHVQFREGTIGGTNAVSIKGPETIANDYSIVLPNAPPTVNGQALTATTAGVASWSTVDVKLDTPVITGDLEVADAGTVTHTITNYDPELTYTFSSLSNCTIGTINTSGQFVVTETGDHPAYTVKAETDALGLADSNTLTKQLKTKLSAPTLSSPADDGTATNIVYTITSTHANDNKLILDIGSSNFTYQSVSHGSGSKVGNTVEVTGFTTNNPAVTIQFTAEATYSVTAKAQDTTGTWGESVASSADSITIQNSYTVDYLVVAGGGGSGRSHGGGGGGGGFRASYNNETSGGGGSSETALQLVPGTVYTIDVGAAGTGGDFSATNGAASSISGSDITDVTTVGGGRGASRSPNHGGSSGGSGGGGTDGHPGGPSGSGLAGTTNEGYAGGNGVYGSNHYNGGGGGGAGQVGGNAQIGSPGGGPGGNGQSSTITGSSVTYAGGGGGGMGSGQGANTPGGPGGSGGGGSGGSDGGGNPGTANTGGGGGGAGGSGYWGSTGGGRPGGTGVVILRMATANYNSSGLDGSPTVTTSGSDTILTYTADGEYTG